MIINDSAVYYLEKGLPLYISLSTAQPVTMVLTNGYHITPRLHIPYRPGVNHLFIGCTLEDDVLIAGLLLTTMLFIVSIFSGLYLTQLLSFVPVLYALYLFYCRRKSFLQVRLSEQSS